MTQTTQGTQTPPNDSSQPVVAVTGGAGFIGSHTVDRLVAAGCRVVVVDDFRTGKRSNLAQWHSDPRVAIVEADVADGLFAPLAEITATMGPIERIVHFAAQTSVVHSVANPICDMRINYIGTTQVLEYARYTGVRKVVFSSSAAIYGEVSTLPVTEAMVAEPEGDAPMQGGHWQPMSPYGIDKLGAELLLHYYASVHDVPCTILRFFNVYGPRQDPKSPYSGVISIFADRAMRGAPLTIFGDGGQTRDFVYVGDVARLAAHACLSDSGNRAVVNVATGRETSVNELAHTIVQICESTSTISHAEARAGEIERSVAAVDRARKVFDFAAEVSLQDGLQQTLAWAREPT